MAGPSEVKAGLDAVSRKIESDRAKLKSAKAAIAEVVADLQGLPSQYSDVITTINAYDPQSDILGELVAKSELSQLTAEFTQLLNKAQISKAALNGIVIRL